MRMSLEKSPKYPSHYDLRKNGTYLVLRVLEEDVGLSGNFSKRQPKSFGLRNIKKIASAVIDLVAAKIIGRWPSGCPVIRSDKKDDTQRCRRPSRKTITFFTNEMIQTVKNARLGAHIRRTNPRDQLLLTSKDIFDDNRKL